MPFDRKSRKPIGHHYHKIPWANVEISKASQARAAVVVEPAAEIWALQIGGAIGGGGMESKDLRASDCAKVRRQRHSLKPRMNGISSLRVRALELEQVARLLADAGAAQPYAGRGERAQAAR
jgi:hypothetical protein